MTDQSPALPGQYKSAFVFQEGIDRTNIQRAELLALLEMFYEDLSYEIKQLDSPQAREGFGNGDVISFEEPVLDSVDEGRIAQIIFLKQSAIVFSNFEIELVSIVARAGYIQSAGELIFLSKWESLSEETVTDKLNKFCFQKSAHFPVNFYVKSENRDQYQKLDSILIDDTRYHIGPSSFRLARARILKNHEEALHGHSIETKGDGVIFMYKDAQLGQSREFLRDFYVDRNLTEYAVCYLSHYKKENFIHILDSKSEAKPFWAGIFTTPHRLMNAMLNLGKVTKDQLVLDPFCHTGTLAIEASQIGCDVVCADIGEVRGAADNYELLCKGADNFENLTNAMGRLIESDSNVLKKWNDLASESAILNSHGLPEIDPAKKIDLIIDILHGQDGDLNVLENRLLFYIVRRFELNRKRLFEDEFGESLEMARQYLGTKTNEGDSKGPGPKYYNGYYHFSKQSRAFEDAFKKDGIPVIRANHSAFNDLFEDHQYLSNRIGYVSHAQSIPRFLTRDILGNFSDYGLDENSLDALVTDPPYGYGEGLEKGQIRDIYANLFSKAFRWLKHGGHLVFCTLDKVRTGRVEGLLFTEDILNLCNRIAARERIEFINHNVYPIGRDEHFLCYWKSKSALNRAVVVLKIAKHSPRHTNRV